MLPNDFFKRPGAHHAYEIDRAAVERLRGALLPLQRFGSAVDLAALTARSTEELLAPGGLYGLEYSCLAAGAEDFGLADYGPLFAVAGVELEVGELLVAHFEPMSAFWYSNQPWFPQRLVSARELRAHLETCSVLGDEHWATIREEMTRNDDEGAPELEEYYRERTREADAILPIWRASYGEEVARCGGKLAELARRDAWVMTWFSEQGWL